MRAETVSVSWFIGTILGTLFYLGITLLIAAKARRASTRLILLGLLTTVMSIWYGGLPTLRDLAIATGELPVALPNIVSARPADLLAKIGVVLALSGVAILFLRKQESDAVPRNSTKIVNEDA